MTPPHDAISERELGEWAGKVRDAIFYARAHARSKGYALAVHGTLRRDVDVVAVPWTDEACDPDELVESIADNFIALGLSYEGGKTHMQQSREVKPFGRLAYALPLKGIPAPYLDMSVAPRAGVSAPSPVSAETPAISANDAEFQSGYDAGLRTCAAELAANKRLFDRAASFRSSDHDEEPPRQNAAAKSGALEAADIHHLSWSPEGVRRVPPPAAITPKCLRCERNPRHIHARMDGDVEYREVMPLCDECLGDPLCVVKFWDRVLAAQKAHHVRSSGAPK